MLLNEGLRDVSSPAACHWGLHRQTSGIPRHTNERCECISLPLLCAPPERPSELDSRSRSHDHLVALVSASHEGTWGPSRLQLRHLTAHDLEVHRLTDPCHRAVTFLSSQPSPRTATVVTFDTSTEHKRRVSKGPWQDDAPAVNLVTELLLQHTDVSPDETFDPPHFVLSSST